MAPAKTGVTGLRAVVGTSLFVGRDGGSRELGGEVLRYS
jgi:hypothetical protein